MIVMKFGWHLGVRCHRHRAGRSDRQRPAGPEAGGGGQCHVQGDRPVAGNGAGGRKWRSQSGASFSRSLRERHYNTAGELLGTALFTEFHGDLGVYFEALDELLRGIAAVGELTPRTMITSLHLVRFFPAGLFPQRFPRRGLDATMIDSRECIVTDNEHMRAAPLMEETNQRLRQKVQPALDKGRVPVMGGFICATKAGITLR